VPCDGGEDCDGGGECCFANLSVQCVAVDQCRVQTGQEICVTNADCAGDETCCSSDLLTGFGLDAGLCLPAADNCVLNTGAP
jgi:hypothetical protein